MIHRDTEKNQGEVADTHTHTLRDRGGGGGARKKPGRTEISASVAERRTRMALGWQRWCVNVVVVIIVGVGGGGGCGRVHLKLGSS